MTALTPFSVDGTVVAASITLLADSRSLGRGGALPWALLVVGSAASLAANIAVTEPTLTGPVIAALAVVWTDRGVRAADAPSARQRDGWLGTAGAIAWNAA